MKKYVIIKLCCFDCRQFFSVYFTDSYYLTFIKNLEDYADYDYLVYKNAKLYCLVGGGDV